MIRYAALVALLALAGCNRHGVADVTLDADAAQRNVTAAKALTDLAAADAASEGPAPIVHTPAAPAVTEPVANDASEEPADSGVDEDANAAD